MGFIETGRCVAPPPPAIPSNLVDLRSQVCFPQLT